MAALSGFSAWRALRKERKSLSFEEIERLEPEARIVALCAESIMFMLGVFGLGIFLFGVLLLGIAAGCIFRAFGAG